MERASLCCVLLKNGASINAQNNLGETPIFLTIYNITIYDLCRNNEERSKRVRNVVSLLLQNGALTDIQNKKGKTPRQEAKQTELGSLFATSFIWDDSPRETPREEKQKGETPQQTTQDSAIADINALFRSLGHSPETHSDVASRAGPNIAQLTALANTANRNATAALKTAEAAETRAASLRGERDLANSALAGAKGNFNECQSRVRQMRAMGYQHGLIGLNIDLSNAEFEESNASAAVQSANSEAFESQKEARKAQEEASSARSKANEAIEQARVATEKYRAVAPPSPKQPAPSAVSTVRQGLAFPSAMTGTTSTLGSSYSQAQPQGYASPYSQAQPQGYASPYSQAQPQGYAPTTYEELSTNSQAQRQEYAPTYEEPPTNDSFSQPVNELGSSYSQPQPNSFFGSKTCTTSTSDSYTPVEQVAPPVYLPPAHRESGLGTAGSAKAHPEEFQ